MNTDDKKLHDVIAAEEIRQKLYTYARACDRNDIELGASIFTEDSRCDYGQHFAGTGREFFEWVIPTHVNYFDATTHRIANIMIKVNGDAAVSETYVFSFNVYKTSLNPEGKSVADVARGRYLDKWACIDGNWLIKERQFLQDSAHKLPITDFAGPWAERNNSDPVFALFDSI